MAEKYGTIPKRFTKEWFEYFWEYYKIHTIVVLAILFAVGVTVYQVKTTPKYDMTITYVGEAYLDENTVTKITDMLAEVIPDTDNNGEKNININQIVFTENDDNPQYTQAVITKLQLEFVDDESMLFIFSDEKSQYLFDTEALAGAFQPVSQWNTSEFDKESLYFSKGDPYGVMIDKDFIDYGNYKLYAAVRTPRTNDDDELNQKVETAKTAANILIKK